ncbi:MAG: nitrous oxide reductase accessory protein NosL [Acidobacteria bacterium]|nr:nitrous oxide reductase accessory protein NosL [Acidobacteriota bacterium]
MRRAWVLLVALVASCAPAATVPVTFDAAHEACAFCRMTGSNGRAAGQLVTPGEEPLFFDDIGCLRDYLAKTPAAKGAVAFVTDYTTREWLRADEAIFVMQPTVETPMGSHLTAFASETTLQNEPAAAGGSRVTTIGILGKKQ